MFGPILANQNLGIKENVGTTSSTGYTFLNMLSSGSTNTFQHIFSTTNQANFIFTNTANYTYTFPAVTGTLALTSNLGGTTGYLPKYASGTSLGQSLFYDNGTYTGINTIDSVRALTIFSSTADTQFGIAGTAPSMLFASSVLSPTYNAKIALATSATQYAGTAAAGDFVISNSSGNILIAFNSVEKARFNSNGTFSIGNTNSTYNIDVTGTGRFTSSLIASSFSSTTGSSFATSSGNVLIGTSTDNSVKLRVNGNIEVMPANTSNSNIRLVTCTGDGGSNTAQVYWNIAFGSKAAGGCLGAYDRSGNYASPGSTLTSSNTWTIFGFIGI